MLQKFLYDGTKQAAAGLQLALVILWSFLPQMVSAQNAVGPNWWYTGDSQFITGEEQSNQSPVNIGQAKNVVLMALAALDASGNPLAAEKIKVDLIGPPLIFNVIEPKPETPDEAWFQQQMAPLLVGQLKALALPFYDRLNELDSAWLATQRTENQTQDLADATNIYPWTSAPDDDENFAVANIGQLKAAFAFRFEGLSAQASFIDENGDGLDDTWVYRVINASSTDSWNLPNDLNQANAAAAGAATGNGTPPSDSPVDSDGDGVDDSEDADPNDPVIDWKRTSTPNFAAIEIPIENPEQLSFKDLTDEGMLMFDRVVPNSWEKRHVVIDAERGIHEVLHASGAGEGSSAEETFATYARALFGDLVLGAWTVGEGEDARLKNGFWNPVDGSYHEYGYFYDEGYYDDDILDVRDGAAVFRGQARTLGVLPKGSSQHVTLPGSSSIASARIEENGNIVGGIYYWRYQAGVYGERVEASSAPSPGDSLIYSATIEQQDGEETNSWNLVEGGGGTMRVAKAEGGFVSSSVTAASSETVVGLSQSGWFATEKRIWANGEWLQLKDILEDSIDEAITSVSLLDMVDTGLSVANVTVANGEEKIFLLLPVEVVPDWNRDGKITGEDRSQVTDDNPFRWWINDDDDIGEAAGGKGAKGDIPNNGTEDYRDNAVDGMRDLVDFFPLYLDLEDVLSALPPEEYTYRLKHSQGAFKFLEIPEIIPDGNPETDGAGSFIRSLDRATTLSSHALMEASSSGQDLGEAMLNALKEGNGVLLLEATRETTAPLQLEILKGTNSLATIDFPVRVSKVEDMYRHVDLRSIPTEYDGSAISAPASVNGTKTGDPGDPYPDELTNGKYFAFLHGYNVSQDKARGWHAETFKRLHQMGSRARYVSLVWQGDTGLDYHKAVFQAFQTGDQLNGAMGFVDGDLTIAAHSLGNMVVSQAIQNGGFAPDRYYLLNAAVAREAYGMDIPAAERTQMIEDGTQLGNNGPHFRKWRSYDGAGQSRLLSPQWHTLFPANDNRSKLKWNSFFNNASNLPLYNFYSPGDEVVRNPIDPTASALALILDRGFDFSTYAWANQEYVKGGTSLAGNFMERNQGGWVYNYFPPDAPEEGDPVPAETFETGYFKDARSDFMSLSTYRKYLEAEARDELTNAELRLKPFFKPFLELGLFDAATGSALAGQSNVKYDLLARGLPALSFAAAANPVIGAQGSFNMEGLMTDSQRWPLENHQSDEDAENPEDDLWRDRWLHSDLKNVALSHVYKMFNQMIETGGLDQ